MSALASDGLPPLRDVIARHGLAARKSLGQNFLLDLNLTAKIARSAGKLDDVEVFEVGPGPGGLTRALLAAGAKRVVAVERDARCLDALAEVSAHWPGRLTVIEGDALEINPADHLNGPAKIIANLPYNIGTELLIRWIAGDAWPPFWDSATLMFQKEVAERIAATPGTKAFGRLAVLAQWRSTVEIPFTVSPQAFTPPPKVTSAIVRFSPREEPVAVAHRATLERVTAAAFNQRRKMLRQSLKALGGDPRAHLDKAGIAEERRAETLSIEEFCALAESYRT